MVKIFTKEYNSQELDKESDLYFFNARHYDPEIARFVTADTVIDGNNAFASWNRFAYVQGNPIRYKDSTGNDSTDEGGLVSTGFSMQTKKANTDFQSKLIAPKGGDAATEARVVQNIFQATRSGKSDHRIVDAATGDISNEGKYKAGRMYINREGQIYDVTNLKLNKDKTISDVLIKDRNWQFSDTDSRAKAPWLSKDQLESIRDNDSANPLWQNILDKDNAIGLDRSDNAQKYNTEKIKQRYDLYTNNGKKWKKGTDYVRNIKEIGKESASAKVPKGVKNNPKILNDFISEI